VHNKELHNLNALPDIIRVIKSRRMRWAGHAAYMGQMRNTYNILVGKPEGTRPLGRRGHREDNIKIYLREVRLKVVGWIHLAQDTDQWRALVNTIMNLRFPYKARNFFTS
jgi:hypothetical protein